MHKYIRVYPNHKLFFLAITAFLATLMPVGILPAKAQGQITPAVIDNSFRSLPDIQVSKINARVLNKSVTGTFSLSNSETASYGNLQYQISLIGPRPSIEPNKIYLDNSAVYDRFVSPDILEISGKKSKNISFTYSLPDVATGLYRLRIQAITTKGVPLGRSDFELNINNQDNKTGQINLYLGNVTAKSAPEGKTAGEGITVEPGEEFTINYSVENKTGKTQTLTPSLTIWEFAKNRPKVETTTGKAIVVANDKTSNNQLTVKATAKPEAYHAEIVLKDNEGKPVSNIGEYRWVVSGPSAEISFIRITQPAFLKGEQLSVEAEVVGAADQVTAVNATAEVTVLSGETTIVTQKSTPTDLGTSAKTYTVKTTLNQDVPNPVIRVRVLDSNGNILDEDIAKLTQPDNYGFKQEQTPSTTQNAKAPWTLIIMGTLALIIAITVIGWLLLKGKKTEAGTTLMIFFILIGGFVLLKKNTLAVEPTCIFNFSRVSCTGYTNGEWQVDTHCTCTAYGRGCPGGPGSERACGPGTSRFTVFSPQDENSIPVPDPISERTINGDFVVHFSGQAKYYRICGNQPYPTTGNYSIRTSDGNTIQSTDFSKPGAGKTPTLVAFPDIIADITFAPSQPNNRGSIILSLNEVTRELSNGKYKTETTSTLTQNLRFASLSCSSVSGGNIYTDTPSVFSVSGGDGNYTWSAADGNPVSGSGTSFTTSFGMSGTKNITATDGTGAIGVCSITASYPPLACATSPNPGTVNQTVSFTASGGDTSWNVFKFMEGTTIAQQSASNIFSKIFPTAGTKNLTVQKCDGLQCQNLLSNPGFENGIAGYTTQYVTGNTLAGNYGIRTNPNNWWSGYLSFGGDGNMLLIDSASTSKEFICQEVPVEPNKAYTLSLVSRSIRDFRNVPVHKWFVNNTAITENITPTSGAWLATNVTWNSGSATTAKVCGKNISTHPDGADFAIDNLSFHPELADCVAQPNCDSASTACAAEVANAAASINISFRGNDIPDDGTAQFGEYSDESPDIVERFTITNNGDADLVISHLWVVSGSGAGDFYFPDGEQNGGILRNIPTIRQNESTTFRVAFKPQSNTSDTALRGNTSKRIEIISNARNISTDSIFDLNVSGSSKRNPTVDLKFNGKDTGVNVVRGGTGDLTWEVANVTDRSACTTSSNWTYDGTENGNQDNITINATTEFALTCGSANDSVTVNVQDSVSGTDVRDL